MGKKEIMLLALFALLVLLQGSGKAPASPAKQKQISDKIEELLKLGVRAGKEEVWRRIADELCELGRYEPTLVIKLLAQVQKKALRRSIEDLFDFERSRARHVLVHATACISEWYVQGNLSNVGSPLVSLLLHGTEEEMEFVSDLLRNAPRLIYETKKELGKFVDIITGPGPKPGMANFLSVWESKEAVESIIQHRIDLYFDQLEDLLLLYIDPPKTPEQWESWWKTHRARSLDSIIKESMGKILQKAQSLPGLEYAIAMLHLRERWARRTGLWLDWKLEGKPGAWRVRSFPAERLLTREWADFLFENTKSLWQEMRDKPRKEWVRLGLRAAFAFLKEKKPETKTPDGGNLRALWTLSQFVDSPLTNDCRLSLTARVYKKDALERVVRGWPKIERRLVWDEERTRYVLPK